MIFQWTPGDQTPTTPGPTFAHEKPTLSDPFVRAREKKEKEDSRWERFEQAHAEDENMTFSESLSRCGYEFGWWIFFLCVGFIGLCWIVFGGFGGIH